MLRRAKCLRTKRSTPRRFSRTDYSDPLFDLSRSKDIYVVYFHANIFQERNKYDDILDIIQIWLRNELARKSFPLGLTGIYHWRWCQWACEGQHQGVARLGPLRLGFVLLCGWVLLRMLSFFLHGLSGSVLLLTFLLGYFFDVNLRLVAFETWCACLA